MNLSCMLKLSQTLYRKKSDLTLCLDTLFRIDYAKLYVDRHLTFLLFSATILNNIQMFSYVSFVRLH